MRTRIPRMTYLLIAINIGMFVVEYLHLGPGLLMGITDPMAFLSVGAQNGITVNTDGQMWRLISSMFVHLNLLHLAFNMFALYVFGKDLETLLGPVAVLATYLITGLVGNIASLIYLPMTTISAGASGAIFGIMGCIIVVLLIGRTGVVNTGYIIKSYVWMVLINFAYDFFAVGINLTAHVAGLLAGLVLGVAFAIYTHFRTL